MCYCVFFGHRNFDYGPYTGQIEGYISFLAEKGVYRFYSGGRGNFDAACGRAVGKLKQSYPKTELIYALSYMPAPGFELPALYDGSEYLLEKSVPPRYAISATNRLLAEKCGYVISGVFLHSGGAYAAVAHARRLNKIILQLKRQ